MIVIYFCGLFRFVNCALMKLKIDLLMTLWRLENLNHSIRYSDKGP